MKATCRSQSGVKVDLDVLDLSPIGCLVRRRAWSAQAKDRILVQLPGLGFQSATISWVEGELAGIEFEQLMHEAVLERLQARLADELRSAA